MAEYANPEYGNGSLMGLMSVPGGYTAVADVAGASSGDAPNTRLPTTAPLGCWAKVRVSAPASSGSVWIDPVHVPTSQARSGFVPRSPPSRSSGGAWSH